jgi:hypothetical protein
MELNQKEKDQKEKDQREKDLKYHVGKNHIKSIYRLKHARAVDLANAFC